MENELRYLLEEPDELMPKLERLDSLAEKSGGRRFSQVVRGYQSLFDEIQQFNVSWDVLREEIVGAANTGKKRTMTDQEEREKIARMYDWRKDIAKEAGNLSDSILEERISGTAAHFREEVVLVHEISKRLYDYFYGEAYGEKITGGSDRMRILRMQREQADSQRGMGENPGDEMN
jgi:hypothetical protein